MRQINSVQQLCFEHDLRETVEPHTLVNLVFEALHAVEENGHSGEFELSAGRPRVFLTLLTYAYAIGVYGSEEIERQVKQNEELTYLTARITVTATDLRQFRRYHHQILQSTLARLLQLVWREQQRKTSDPSRADVDYPGWPAECLAVFERAADRRIREAMLADTMALDN